MESTGCSNKKTHCTNCIIVAIVLNFPVKFSGSVPDMIEICTFNANVLTKQSYKINAQLVNDHMFEFSLSKLQK